MTALRRIATSTYCLLLAFLLLALGAAAALLYIGNSLLATQFPLSPSDLRVTAGNAAEGRRLTRVFGCIGCHAADLSGEDFYGQRSANLTRVAREYSLNDFARLVRRGIRPDGTSVTWSMPSDFLTPMADDQVADIHAYLSSLTPLPDGGVTWRTRLPMTQIALATGAASLSGAVSRPEPAPIHAPKPGDEGFGAYFTRVACSECHGFDLMGDGFGSPPLPGAILNYDRDSFALLMRTGRSASGDANLPLMSGTARGRFSHMTDAEIGAVYDWLSRQSGL